MNKKSSETLTTIIGAALEGSDGDLLLALGFMEFAKLQLFQLTSFANLREPKTQEAFKKLTKEFLKKD